MPSTRMTLATRRTNALAGQFVDRGGQCGVGGGVGHQHERGRVAATLLPHALDAHTVPRERAGDRGEHARLIGDVERHVVAGGDLTHRLHGQCGVGTLAGSPAAVDPVAGDGDEVAEDRAGGGRAAGPTPVEHQRAGGFGLDEHRIERVADAGQRVGARDHRRVHPHGNVLRAVGGERALADGQQLDRAAHRLGAGQVGGGDLADALAVDVGRGDPRVERQAGQDRGLRCGVEAVDVRGGIGFGVAERRGLGQRLVEARAGGVHAGQDEVGGAVDDADDPGDPVAGERLAQWPQQRDRTGDGGLVVEVDTGLGRRVVQRRAVLGKQRLVRADHALAGVQRGEQQRAYRLDTADHLDDEVDVVADDKRLGVGREQIRRDVGVLRRPAHRHTGQFERNAHASRQVVGLLVHEPHDLRTHDPAAEQRDPQRVAHGVATQPGSRRSRSSSVSRRTMTLEDPSRTATTGGLGTWL